QGSADFDYMNGTGVFKARAINFDWQSWTGRSVIKYTITFATFNESFWSNAETFYIANGDNSLGLTLNPAPAVRTNSRKQGDNTIGT
ncbi:hypothetical protein OE165_27615, partial [Escherichia coli]|uniref:hypothetical protein n=1 Tax=Escherichia coli TaxID=562 RepID=UPI0021F310FC